MQVPILSGLFVDSSPDMRNAYPRNMMPIPMDSGITNGYMKPIPGVELRGNRDDCPGTGRGGINWNGRLYRVLGTKLCRVSKTGTVAVLGDVGGIGQVSMDYGFDRLAIVSGGNLFYWNGEALTQVTDPDLGRPIAVKWLAGYFVLTDGINIIVTELTDSTSINPLKYGSAESDPDIIQSVDSLRNELYAFGRYTVEVFQNVGGDLFPFQRLEGALIPKGVIGTSAYCSIGNTFVFLGSGRDEAPAVYMVVPGDTVKISTSEIDQLLLDQGEEVLSKAVMEYMVDRDQQLVYLHLPDKTLVYDTISSKAVGQHLWHTRDSGVLTPSMYRARNLIWCYDEWTCEDPVQAGVGVLTDAVSTHYGTTVGWEFSTLAQYAGGNDLIIHEMELVALPGRVAFGADPVVWTSHSFDGETWSMERATRAGKQGDRSRRLAWRGCGRIRHYRMQKFRGTSDAHLPVARLELRVEQLMTRPANG